MKKPCSIVTNEDCMDMMSRYDNNFFDLAVVDPPYGIGMSGYKTSPKKGNGSNWAKKKWDNNIPSKKYFDQLFRISKNQVIWGANHYVTNLNNSRGWIVWYKETNGYYSDAELAYTSFQTPIKLFNFVWDGFRQGDMKNKEKRIHPTQKPIALYRWIFKNYADAGQKILDTHLGSGSSRIAAYEMDMNFYACELDKDYFNAQEKRFKERPSVKTDKIF